MKASDTTATAEEKPTDYDLDDRTERALTEYLTVLEDVGRARGAEDLYLVVSQSGNEYLVDADLGACECPDAEYNLSDGEQCKHESRVAFATGAEPIPAGVDDVDDQLGAHVSATPRVAAADGGAVAAEDEESDTETGRPDECDCWDADLDVPCWPCYLAGYEEQNPETPGAKEGEA
jgi:hypothetical protein